MKKTLVCGILLPMMKRNAKTKQELQGAGLAEPPEAPASNKPMSLRKELLGLLCLLLALSLFCSVSVSVLIPKRYDYGAVWGMYAEEPKDSTEVLFLGSSLIYCDVVPSVIYEETGITSFIMGGPEQTIPITYRYLREACKTQQPQAVWIEATGLLYGKSNRSTKVNLTYMPWNENRLIPTLQESLTEGGKTPEETEQLEKDTRLSLLFPMYTYHNRWDKLTQTDYREGLWGYDPDPLAGYTFLEEVSPINAFQVRDFKVDPDNYDRNLEYAGKMVEFCKSKKIRPVFFLTPLANRIDGEWTARIAADLQSLGAEFVDFNSAFEEPGFDLSVDFFDPLHLNYRGAEKFSRYLANQLSRREITPSGKEDKALWQERVDKFAALRDEADSRPIKLNQSKQ